MADMLLEVQHVSKRFGGFNALTDVSLQVRQGERFGLIGPNGSGKTTLINCISGALRGDGGRILFQGTDITRLPAHQRTRLGIARSFQIPRPFTSMTVLEICVFRWSTLPMPRPMGLMWLPRRWTSSRVSGWRRKPTPGPPTSA